MAAGTQQGLVDAIKIDLQRMHETWMEFVYPRQRGADDTVLGKWKPQEGIQVYLYRLWSALGVPVVALVYPLVLLGYFIRAQTRRVTVTATRIGLLGVVVLFVLVWSVLSLVVAFPLQSAFSSNALVAVVAASSVSVISAALAFIFWRFGGRVLTVLLAYPFAMTAIFLPPVVAGLYSNAVADFVLRQSDSIAIWLIENGPDVAGVKTYLTENFELAGPAYVLMWFGISVPVGWFLGLVVALADLVRPTPE